jgi:alpha-tubulin suppressor-like RCC1 family protein
MDSNCYSTTIGLIGNKLYAWGGGSGGQLGDNGLAVSANSIAGTSWSQIAANGYGPTFGIKTDGSLWTWGSGVGIFGYFGGQGLNSSTVISYSSPVQVGSSSWSQVATNGIAAAAIRSDGGLFTWGCNQDGGLGQNNLIHRSSPVQIGSSSWVAVSVGGGAQVSNNVTILGILTTGALFGWGYNGSGQVGDGSASNRSAPVQIGTSSWTQVSAGIQHTVAVKSNFNIYTWGNNGKGQLGDTTTVSKSSPVLINASFFANSPLATLGKATVIVAGVDSTSIIGGATTGARGLWTWGDNTYGLLGSNSVAHRSSPVQIGTSSWTAVAAASSYGAAIRSDGGLFTWGGNVVGQLGDGSATTVNRSSPVQVGTSSWTQISASDGNSNTGLVVAAISSTNSAAFITGTGVSGNLGIGTAVTVSSLTALGPYVVGIWARSSPIQIGSSSWTQVAVSNGNSFFAKRNDGTIFAWGLNTNGELGLNDLVHRSSPVQVGAGSWNTVGTNGVFGPLASTNAMYLWGSNTIGQLGDNTVVSRSSPVQVASSLYSSTLYPVVSPTVVGASALKVAAGAQFTAYVGSGSGLYTW